MLSQKQNNLNWPDEEIPPSFDQEETATSTSSWRGWSLWLRVLGVIVALIGQFAMALLFSEDFGSLGILLLILVGVVSAGLIRSWWSLLILPVVLWVGITLPDVFMSGFGGFFGNLLSEAKALVIALLDVGVLIGTPIGMWIEKRLRH